MQNNPIYRVSFKGEFKNYSHAMRELTELGELRLESPKGILLEEEGLEVTYYIPQPQYKSWVPNWLINFITKKS